MQRTEENYVELMESKLKPNPFDFDDDVAINEDYQNAPDDDDQGDRPDHPEEGYQDINTALNPGYGNINMAADQDIAVNDGYRGNPRTESSSGTLYLLSDTMRKSFLENIDSGGEGPSSERQTLLDPNNNIRIQNHYTSLNDDAEFDDDMTKNENDAIINMTINEGAGAEPAARTEPLLDSNNNTINHETSQF